jgi:triphosphatase
MTIGGPVDLTCPRITPLIEMVGTPTEVELKLWVAPEDIAAVLSNPRFADSLHDPTRATLDSVYFDSEDRFLRDHGLTLRVRHDGDKRVQTIKSADSGVGLFERSEWEETIENDQPDVSRVRGTALGQILTDEVGKELKPVFETRIERTAYHLNGNGADIIFAIDEGKILASDSSQPVSEIELELRQGNPADLFKIARDILDIVPAHLEFKSKPERGYQLLDKTATGAETGFDPELLPGMSAGRAFTLIGRACLRHLVANVPAMLRRDETSLHQMRVALRRLRAAISLFSLVTSDTRSEAVKTELRWLAQELGPARDLDTLISEVIKPLHKQHANEPGFASISNMFTRKRLKSYKHAQEAVQSARFRSLILDTTEWIEAGPWTNLDDNLKRAYREMPIEIYAAEQLSHRRKRIRRRGKRIAALSPDQLHRLRIHVKKARYAADFFCSVYTGKKSAKQCKKIRSSLMQLQNCLGRLNDIVTHKALFSEIIANRPKGLTEEQGRRRAFAAGLIIGDQQAQVEKLLDRARKAYSRLDDAKPFWKVPGSVTASPEPPPPVEQPA